ncbi:MAG: LysR family transcriptional regulator, partial [Paracoccaceae bacterium]
LALHHAARFRDAIEVQPLPFAPLERTLSLSARAGVLRDVPGQIAGRLRGLIGVQVVGPARSDWPWLGQSLRVL